MAAKTDRERGVSPLNINAEFVKIIKDVTMKINKLLVVFGFVTGVFTSELSIAAEPLEPVPPVPSKQQMAWQHKELLMFAHFGIKTFYPSDNHMGTGEEDPRKFNPKNLDASQWVSAAQAGGFKGIVLTAKHHDGFCNWQTKTTDFGVKSSPWKNGKGDVVKELADACRRTGMWFGLYLSAYDVHYQKSGLDKKAYSQYYETQLTKLCTNYGVVDELWFDGMGANEMSINWKNITAIIQKHQPNAVILHSGMITDMPATGLRWPGNELGDAGEPNWSVHPWPDKHLKVDEKAIWYPAEADTIAQGNWFWNNRPICSLSRLKEIYITSVGRNGLGLINVPPNQNGLIDEASIVRLKEFKGWVDGIYSRDAAFGKQASASTVRGNDPRFGPKQAVDNDYETYYSTDDNVTTGHIEVDLGKSMDIDGVIIQEYIPLGQRIAEHRVEFWDSSAWRRAISGATVGFKRIHWKKFKTQRVRLVITRSRACPLISSFLVIRSSAAVQKMITKPTAPPSGGLIDISHSGTAYNLFGRDADEIKRWQTFIANPYPNITSVDVKIKKHPGTGHSDVTVELFATRFNLPTGSPMASTTIPASSVSDSLAVVNAPLTYNGLVSGTEYAIVLGQQTWQPGVENLYAWCNGVNVSDDLQFGKWNDYLWVNESSQGDGWMKVYVSSEDK